MANPERPYAEVIMPSTDGMRPWQAQMLLKNAADLQDPGCVYFDRGWRWRSNDSVIMPATYEEADLPVPEGQSAFYQAHLDDFLADYRKNAQPPSQEEVWEMRAAFGAGTRVVNIVTGQVTQL